MRDQKTSVFHAAQFCVTTRGAKTLYRASLFISSKAVDRECIGPAFFPAWITHLPTPQGCGQPFGCVSYPGSKLTFFRVDKSSICPPSSWPHSRRFFFENFHPKQPRAPPPFGRQIAGARARERTGAQPQGPGAACPTRRSALGAGRRPGGVAATRPLCSAPLGGPRYGSPDAS